MSSTSSISSEALDERASVNATRTRELLEAAISAIGAKPGFEADKCIVLMSGGVDSSVTAELAHRLLGVRHVVTVIATPSPATDTEWAHACAKKLALAHTVLTPSLEELLSEQLPFAVEVLKSFDPMALRNSGCASMGLRWAAQRGFKWALTGDGADEVLGGYSFTAKLDDDVWVTNRERMVAGMHFDSVHLGAAVGMQVYSPFCDADFVRYALTLTKKECVSCVRLRAHPCAELDDTHTPHTGKLPLRHAFPESVSAWRRKDPAEVGCGTTILGSAPWAKPPRPGYFDTRMSDDDFDAEKTRVRATYAIELRDKEHLAYFKVFAGIFGYGSSSLCVPGKERPNGDPCPACGFHLGRPDSTFCVTCGHYEPAMKDRGKKEAS